MKNIAIVTGASGGLGREFVALLESEVDEIWTIARNCAKLDELYAEYGKKVVPVCLDLSERDSFGKVDAMLDKDEYNVRWLVNAAGYGKFCAYDDIDVAQSLNIIDLNVNALVAIGLIALKHMTKGSRIVNIASISAFQPLPYMNIYASTKAFVRNYTRALNVELKPRGITATAVCPGWMATPFLTRAEIGADKGVTKFKHLTTPKDVAARAIADAKKGKDMSVYGGYNKTCHLASKMLTQKAMMNLWLKQQKNDK